MFRISAREGCGTVTSVESVQKWMSVTGMKAHVYTRCCQPRQCPAESPLDRVHELPQLPSQNYDDTFYCLSVREQP